MASIIDYFLGESRAHQPFAGQLAPMFQKALERHFAAVSEAECTFTHTLELADGRVIPGTIDLRGIEQALLGGVRLWGKRVLELFPESGWLSAYIAARADDLVCLDAPLTVGQSPEHTLDTAAERVRRGWWLARAALPHDARAVYADLYRPPHDLGLFDTVVCAGALSRLAHPVLALASAARLSRDTVVIAEALPDDHHISDAPDGTQAILLQPVAGQNSLPLWRLTPAAVQALLTTFGFTEQALTYAAPVRGPGQFFTVVARRPRGAPAPSLGLPDWAVCQPFRPPATVTPAALASAAPLQPPIALPPEQDDTLPLPPPHRRFMVAGTEDVEAFVQLGRAGFGALMGSLQRANIAPPSLGRVLDFGCGVGRVLRHWHTLPGVELFGTDLDADAIAWATENLPFARFATNSLEPRLPYDDRQFGLVYALSVFTHLPEDIQRPWFAELLRVIRPGGHLYFTTHGVSYRDKLPPGLLPRFDAGDLVVTGAEQPGSNHCGVFHPVAWVRRALLAPCGADLVEFLPQGAAGNPTQDSWLVRKA